MWFLWCCICHYHNVILKGIDWWHISTDQLLLSNCSWSSHLFQRWPGVCFQLWSLKSDIGMHDVRLSSDSLAMWSTLCMQGLQGSWFLWKPPYYECTRFSSRNSRFSDFYQKHLQSSARLHYILLHVMSNWLNNEFCIKYSFAGIVNSGKFGRLTQALS